jgi:hypothetical protein
VSLLKKQVFAFNSQNRFHTKLISEASASMVRNIIIVLVFYLWICSQISIYIYIYIYISLHWVHSFSLSKLFWSCNSFLISVFFIFSLIIWDGVVFVNFFVWFKKQSICYYKKKAYATFIFLSEKSIYFFTVCWSTKYKLSINIIYITFIVKSFENQ